MKYLNHPNAYLYFLVFMFVVSLVMAFRQESRPDPRYGTVYQITEGFYTGCTGKAVRASRRVITLDQVVCITDSLDIEVTVPVEDVVVWQEPHY